MNFADAVGTTVLIVVLAFTVVAALVELCFPTLKNRLLDNWRIELIERLKREQRRKDANHRNTVDGAVNNTHTPQLINTEQRSMSTITPIKYQSITFDQLRNALCEWELEHRAGKCRPPEEVAAMTPETVAVENANHIWGRLEKFASK